MDEYQNQARETSGIAKREPSQDVIPKNEDELATLGGKTRLVSKKPQSSSSGRGSRSPVSSPGAGYNSPPPQTPASPTSPVGPSQLQTSFHNPNQLQYQHQFVSPMEPSPISSYSQSPEMTLFGPGNLPPEQMLAPSQNHTHLQVQMHAQAQAQWQNDPSMTLGYSPVGMGQGNGFGNGTQAGPGLGMEGIMAGAYGPGVVSQGQYVMSGQYDMSGAGMQNVYAQAYGPSSQEIISPQDVDINSAWNNWLSQYTNG